MEQNIVIGQKSMTIKGISNVLSISEREVNVTREGERIQVFGTGLNALRLELEQGLLELGFTTLYTVKFTVKGQFKLSKLFK